MRGVLTIKQLVISDLLTLCIKLSSYLLAKFNQVEFICQRNGRLPHVGNSLRVSFLSEPVC